MCLRCFRRKEGRHSSELELVAELLLVFRRSLEDAVAPSGSEQMEFGRGLRRKGEDCKAAWRNEETDEGEETDGACK